MDASVTTSSDVLGISEGNFIKFAFRPESLLPISSGLIKIETPVWATINGTAVYPVNSESLKCFSELFASLNFNVVNESTIEIGYQGYLGLEYQAVEITCENYKNPIEPTDVSGFKISTFTNDVQLIDESDTLSLDASSFTPQPLPQDSITIDVSKPYAHELSNYSISFIPGIPIDIESGCFVKYTFPKDINMSQLQIGNTDAVLLEIKDGEYIVL